VKLKNRWSDPLHDILDAIMGQKLPGIAHALLSCITRCVWSDECGKTGVKLSWWSAPHCKLFCFRSRNDLKTSNGPSLRKCGKWCQKVSNTEENCKCCLETDDNTKNWTWSAWDFKRMKWGTQSEVTPMEAATKERKNAVHDRTCKQAELTANPLNIFFYFSRLIAVWPPCIFGMLLVWCSLIMW